MFYFVLCCVVLSCLCLVLSCLILSYPVLSCPVRSCLFLSCLVFVVVVVFVFVFVYVFPCLSLSCPCLVFVLSRKVHESLSDFRFECGFGALFALDGNDHFPQYLPRGPHDSCQCTSLRVDPKRNNRERLFLSMKERYRQSLHERSTQS